MNLKEKFVYIPKAGCYAHLVEGDGSNLWDEDIAEGAVDYIMCTVYEPVCWQGVPTMREVDGAQVLCEKYVADMSDEEFIKRGLDLNFIDPDYEICMCE